MAAAVLLAACTSKPAEIVIDKDSVDLGGNAFSAFCLAGDVNLFMEPNDEDASKWSVKAAVPVKKIGGDAVKGLAMEIVPVDERGVKVRSDLVLAAQDLINVLPVLNADTAAVKTVAFFAKEGSKNDFTQKEAEDILDKTENVAFNINYVKAVETQAAGEPAQEIIDEPEKKEEPVTLNSLCQKYGVYGMLSQYDNLLRKGEKRKAKQVEDRLWEIEKKVMADQTIPQSLRQRFKDYVEDREDQIEDKY